MTPYLDIRNRILSESVTPQVKQLETLGELFAQSFDAITLTEKGHMLSMMLMGTRRLKKSVDKANTEQKKTLLLKADFDAREVKGTLNGIIDKLAAYITKPDDDVETDLEDLLDADNAEALLSSDESGGKHRQMRIYLIENYYNIYNKIKDSARKADELLSNLAQLQRAIEQDKRRREKLWETMLDDYKKQEWPEQEATITYRINQEIADPDNQVMTKAQILERELKLLKTDHIINTHKGALKELNKTVIEPKQTAIDVLMKYRDKLQEEDLSDYFCFFFSYKFITEGHEAIQLRETAQLDMLFCNKAAQEYVETMIPVLKQHGGLNDKSHYGILKIVLQELGLVDANKANGKQMMNFVNEKLIVVEANKLTRQDSITLITGNLNKQIFARLGSKGTLKTKFNDKEYARMKEVYWRCFTILNFYRLVDIDKAGYDSYLSRPHPFTKTNDPWDNVETDTKNRLTFLAFVLRGDGLKF